MIEVQGNLFELPGDVLCITTNGYISSKGKAVMGRGCAAEAKKISPGLDRLLASRIQENGNCVNILLSPLPDQTWISYPVKPVSIVFDGTNTVKHGLSKYQIGETVPGYHAKADLAIIERSAMELRALADTMPEWKTILVPRPGCGAGELTWEQVRPVIEPYFDDRFHVVTFPEPVSDFPSELIYAGIGARATPPEILTEMRKLARSLSKFGFTLRSGGAAGADSAFEQGSASSEIFLPWYRFNGHFSPNHQPSQAARDLASTAHVDWESCTEPTKNLHGRNAEILFGRDLKTPVAFVICWTEEAKDIGGTGLAIRLARKQNIPVFNLANGVEEVTKEIADYLFNELVPTKVVNVHYQPFDVYIGRQHGKYHPKGDSIWHNPFITGQDGTREDVIRLYEEYIRARLQQGNISVRDLLRLRGKKLGCFCKPKDCHGDVLLKLIEEYSKQEHAHV